MLTDDSRQFLQTVFGDKWPQAWVEWWRFDASKKVIPESHGWARAGEADPPDDCAVYFSVGLMKPETTRGSGNVGTVHAITLDDVGKKIDKDLVDMFASLVLPEPTVVETSPDNFQYTWGCPEGLSVLEHVGVRWRIEETYGKVDGPDPARLFRLPMGINGKTEPGKGSFVPRLVSLGKNYTRTEILRAFPAPAFRSPRQGSGVAGGGQQAPSAQHVFDLLAGPLKNTWDGQDNSGLRRWWVDVLLGIKGGMLDEPEKARELAEAWSGMYETDFDRTWDSLHPTSAGWGKLEIMAKEKGSAAWVFDDGVDTENVVEDEEDEEPLPAKPAYVPRGLGGRPRRPWVYGKRLLRGFVSATVAAGGVGKSSLTMVEALSMASRKDLLDVGPERMPKRPLTVWVWNGEDPQAEMELRLDAACLHYKIAAGDIMGRVFVDSGRDMAIKLVAMDPVKKRFVVDKKLVRQIIARIKRDKIDVVIIDPLVAAHYAPENDNTAMDLLMKTLGVIAGECFCAVDVVHHTRKGNGSSEEVTVDEARGAAAIINAARNARVLTAMTRKVGEKYGIKNYKSHFCVSRDAVKANLTPPLDSDYWYEMVGIDMGNGEVFPDVGNDPEPADNVGVATKWTLTVASADRPDLVEKAQVLMGKKQWRYNEQAGKEWGGHPVSEALGIDISEKRGVISVRETIEKWIKEGWLRKVDGFDATRHRKVFVEVGDTPPAWDKD